MSITIRDIAKYSGVSVGTVSKVLNNQGKVREELRVRVQAVIDRLNYRPSSLARGIKKSKTRTIGLIIPRIINSFYIQVIDLIENEIKQRDYSLVLGNTNEDVDREIDCLRTFCNMRVDGLILASTGRNQGVRIKEEISLYDALNIPVVMISRRLPMIQADTVELENDRGAYLATRYLIEKGHRKIAFIASADVTSAGSERMEGYLRALEENHIPFERSLVRTGTTLIESGYEITHRFLSQPNRPTAIFIGSNFQLLGALRAIRDKTIRVPEDISLICFDDTLWSSFFDPPLTVIKTDTEQFCKTAVDLLFDRVCGKFSGAPRCIKLPIQLLVRQSVKAT